jgi:HK97 family phage major capsid protein
MKIEEIRSKLADEVRYVEDVMAEINERSADDGSLTDEDNAAFAAGVAFRDEGRSKLAELEARSEALSARTAPVDVPNFIRPAADAAEVATRASSTTGELRDSILRGLDSRGVDDTSARKFVARHAESDPSWARGLALRSSDVYAQAFNKMMTGRSATLSNEERAAISGATAAEGGVMTPTHLDPTVILTNDGSANMVRMIANVKSHTIGDTWVGVTSAGVTASNDPRQTQVSDDTPGDFAAPSISLHTAQVYAEAEREAMADQAGLAGEILAMFADARDRLEGANHMTGTGSDQPFGIFTALDANAGSEITSAGAAAISLADLQGVKRAVGQRWRGRSSWLMNPTWGDAIKVLGTALSASYSTDITQNNTPTLLGRPVYESDDAPEVTTTTVLDNRLIFGDFSNYVIIDKPGSFEVSFIPQIMGANQRPTGKVGWVGYWRSGADSVNDAAFRLLQDKTSA